MTAARQKPIIGPELKVADLLSAYPELEEVLLRFSPVFKRICSPVGRMTVARLFSLRRAAKIGNLLLGDLITKLREAAWRTAQWDEECLHDPFAPHKPTWLYACKSTKHLDIRRPLKQGQNPVPLVMSAVKRLKNGHAVAVLTEQRPTLIVEKMRKLPFHIWVEWNEDKEYFITYFIKK